MPDVSERRQKRPPDCREKLKKRRKRNDSKQRRLNVFSEKPRKKPNASVKKLKRLPDCRERQKRKLRESG